MTTPYEQPESSEVSSVHLSISKPDTVAESARTDALAALDSNKYNQLMAEVAEMI